MSVNRCPNCGDPSIREVLEPFEFKHGDKTLTIKDQKMKCDNCLESFYVGRQISEHEKAVADAIRTSDGLLTASQLLHVRLKYRLRQTDMERMLSTGAKTWTRWERGKVPQNKAADTLIRIIAEDHNVARHLMQQASVENEEAAATFDEIDRNAKQIAIAKLAKEFGSVISNSAVLNSLSERALETAISARKEAALKVEAA